LSGAPARRRLLAVIGSALLVLLALASLGIGRYSVPFATVVDILRAPLWPVEVHWSAAEQLVVWQLRLPRVLAALLAGAALALAGATLQGMFRNPLVDAGIVGISGGAAGGGVLALFFAWPGLAVAGLAFAGGLAALALVFAISRRSDPRELMTLVLAGLVIGQFCSALVSLLVYCADPERQLPGIVYWLMGSFARIDPQRLALLAGPVLLGGVLLYRLRWRINLLSLDAADAASLGVPVVATRWLLLTLVALLVGAQVAVSGGIGWVGLIVPHLARRLVGPDHRALLPASALLGALLMLAIDDLARSLGAQELPVGLLAALLGTPLFAYLLWRRRSGGALWS